MFEDLDIMIWAPIRTQKIEVGNWGPRTMEWVLRNLPGIQEAGTPYLWCVQGTEAAVGKKPSESLGHSSEASGQTRRVRFTTNRVATGEQVRELFLTQHSGCGFQGWHTTRAHPQLLPRIPASSHPAVKQWKWIRLSLNRTSFFAINC